MFFPNRLPNETIHSRIVRAKFIYGLSNEELSLSLFGKKKARIHPFVTANLIEISSFCNEPPQAIWSRQTLLPLFYGCGASQREAIRDLSLSSSQIFRVCQLANFKEKEDLVIKYCPICNRENLEYFGAVYYDKIHQIPGIKYCYKHLSPLKNRRADNEWLRMTFISADIEVISENVSQIDTELTKYAEGVVNSLPYPLLFDFPYLDRLNELGYVTKSGRLRSRYVSADLWAFVSGLSYRNSPFFPFSPEDHRYWLSMVNRKVPQTPFKHIIFQYWLSKAKSTATYSVPAKKAFINKTLLESLCLVFLSQKLSIGEVSRRICKSRCYVKGVASRHNIATSGTPTKISDSMRSGIIELAAKGFHRNTIAKRFKISNGSVESIISATAGLVEKRKRCKYESKRRRYQAQIVNYLRNAPLALRKDVKRDCNAAFFWLYMHEKQWLENNLPIATKPHAPIQKNTRK